MDKIQTTDAQTLANMLRKGEAILIDVRESGEFTQCHIANAVSLPLTCMDAHLEPFANETRAIVFQCQKGKRGELAAEQALNGALNGKNVYNLSGGIEAWQQAGLPTVTAKTAGKSTIPLNRQVFIAVGSLVFIGSLLAISGLKAGAILALLVSCGLLVAGFTGWCGMALLLQKMPWNR